MPPCRSSLLFALRPIAVAQNQMRMAPCRLAHQLYHAAFQGMDGLVLLQLPIFKQKEMKFCTILFSTKLCCCYSGESTPAFFRC